LRVKTLIDLFLTGIDMIHGILVPIITPFDNNGGISIKGFERLIDFIRSKGINGFVINGTTGIYPYLGLNERKKCIDISLELKKRGDNIVICVGHSYYESVLALINYCKNKEIDNFLIPPPYYMKLDDESLINFFTKIRSVTDKKIIYYNIPQLTNNPIRIDTLEILFKKKIIDGIKDTSGNLKFFQRILAIKEEMPSLSIFMGDDYLACNALISGANGGILGSGNFIPGLWNKLYNLVKEKQFLEALDLQNSILNKIDAMFVGTFPSAIYYILKKMDIDCGEPRFPLRLLNSEEKNKINILLSS
jgi:dihydrodipicolinate synthase/N-acetylneuraminate lyase